MCIYTQSTSQFRLAPFQVLKGQIRLMDTVLGRADLDHHQCFILKFCFYTCGKQELTTESYGRKASQDISSTRAETFASCLLMEHELLEQHLEHSRHSDDICKNERKLSHRGQFTDDNHSLVSLT